MKFVKKYFKVSLHAQKDEILLISLVSDDDYYVTKTKI